jgi:predicted oxidoreductase
VNQGEMIVSSIDFGGDKESVKKEWIVKRKKRTVLFYLF